MRWLICYVLLLTHTYLAARLPANKTDLKDQNGVPIQLGLGHKRHSSMDTTNSKDPFSHLFRPKSPPRAMKRLQGKNSRKPRTFLHPSEKTLLLVQRERSEYEGINWDYLNSTSTQHSNMTIASRRVWIQTMKNMAKYYELSDETVWIAIQYFDRYLSLQSSTFQERDLLVDASLFVAAKWNEDGFYATSKNEALLNMERQLLSVLDYRMALVTPESVLSLVVQDFEQAQALPTSFKYVDSVIQSSQKYLKLGLGVYRLQPCLPSMLALSAFILSYGETALVMSKVLTYSKLMYSESEQELFQQCFSDMVDFSEYNVIPDH